MADITVTGSCISKCRVETLQGKKTTDATLGVFQGCVDSCRVSQDTNALLNDIRGMVQATTSLFKRWVDTEITCAPIEEPVRTCQTRLLELVHNYTVLHRSFGGYDHKGFKTTKATLLMQYTENMTMLVPLPDLKIDEPVNSVSHSGCGGSTGKL